jgi:hypothetical protein
MLQDLHTYLRLGLRNVLRVAWYRVALKMRVHPALYVTSRRVTGPFFRRSLSTNSGLIAPTRWKKNAELFGAFHASRPTCPDWHSNPLSPGHRTDPNLPWHEISDFNSNIGDIKTVWEYSRFGWTTALAQRAAVGDDDELRTLNNWLESWAEENPPYMGVNWKCGQEASIRVIHLAAAAMVLNQVNEPSQSLIDFIKMHCARISPTISYALGQANNHGTSEAAALFIGGSWLVHCGITEGRKWQKKGRQWIEERATALIENDGTFSQYSVVYHRLMLDTYSFAEIWRRKLDLEPFSMALTDRMASAVNWLNLMVDEKSGDAPNIGANDGAHILHLTDASFRDFRPSLSLAGVLFCNQTLFGENSNCQQQLAWLGVSNVGMACRKGPASSTLDDGGFHILRQKRAWAVLRYPRFRFRPSQCDLLHLDLFVDGENILRDAGSYSYNPGDGSDLYFASSEAHNTVTFDERNQMPRLSRFLFGNWPQVKDVSAVQISGTMLKAAASYTDSANASHRRIVSLSDDALCCTDELSGNASTAVVRWRLAAGNWEIDGDTVKGNGMTLHISSASSQFTATLEDGYESRFYLKKNKVTVLTIAVPVPSTISMRASF